MYSTYMYFYNLEIDSSIKHNETPLSKGALDKQLYDNWKHSFLQGHYVGFFILRNCDNLENDVAYHYSQSLFCLTYKNSDECRLKDIFMNYRLLIVDKA